MPNLRIKDGGRDFIHQIEGEVASVGRAPTNTVSIEDGKASKEHCRIEQVGNRWKMVDLESKNGTRVNGDFCNQAWLKHGDTIQIGKAEIRFGMEGARRRVESARPAPAAERRPQPPRDEDYDYLDEDAPPPPRRYGKTANDKLIVAGLVLLGSIGVFYVASKVAASMGRDSYNLGLIEDANEMMGRDQWREALAWLQEHGNPDGNAYPEVQKRMREIASRMDEFYKNRDNQRARQILSDLGRMIKRYHKGSQRATPDGILKLVERLKREYPQTEHAKAAAERYRAWFAGKVPQRATELIRSVGQLLKDWQEAEDLSHEYVKQWRFREARETIEVFLTAREAILDADDLARYRSKVEEALRRIDLQADGIYRARERIAWDLVKNKRYDQAIRVYQEVIEKFGIDLYVRKAQEEINKLRAKKSGRG